MALSIATLDPTLKSNMVYFYGGNVDTDHLLRHSMAWNKSGQASVSTPLPALMAMANRITRRTVGFVGFCYILAMLNFWAGPRLNNIV